MTDKKIKSELTSPLRTPKPKNKLGLKVPQIAMPHDDMIRADVKPELKIVFSPPQTAPIEDRTLARQTSHSSQTRQSTLTSQSPQNKTPEIAPSKNFQKVPNSLAKQAVPEGWFKGKSKQLYDALYSLTRGAIVPTRKVRVQKGKLMKLAGIGSRITFDANIQHLIAVGLISEVVFAGEHEGNEFEVFLPEEISLPSQSSQSSMGSQTSPAQKLDRLVTLETSQTSHSLESTNIRDSDIPKTSFKTLNFIDDEAPVISTFEKLNEMARKITGKDLTKRDIEKFPELMEVLFTETVIAAARTKSVSALVPFMTENLRRRLYSKPRPASTKEGRPIHLNVGKGTEDKNTESFSLAPQPQTPLSEEQRENTLSALREAKEANTIFFREFKTYGEIEYTPEDFEWLLENLK